MNLLKRIVNRCADYLFIPVVTPFWRNRLKGKVMIYLYHRIGEEGDHAFLDVGGSPITPLNEFIADVKFLQSIKATFLRVADLRDQTLDSDSVYAVLCFDDGFKSNYGEVLEWLDSQGISTTIFQVSSMVENQKLIWEHQLYFIGTRQETAPEFWQAIIDMQPSIQKGDFSRVRELVSDKEILTIIESILSKNSKLKNEMAVLASELYPSVAELKSAQQRGHEIGSHGHKHYFRPCISGAQFEDDLKKSVNTLKGYGCELFSFSYPFNQYVSTDKPIAEQYFKMIATVNAGAMDNKQQLTALPRNTWPGMAKNVVRRRRWLLTGRL